MGILSAIKEKLLGTKSTTAKATTAATITAASATTAAAAAAKSAPVDVEAIIEAAAKAKGGKFNWRVSIVDLLRVLDLDSSFAARKELAGELKYGGSYSGTAEQNTLLLKEVMKMLADNGGKLPKELLK